MTREEMVKRSFKPYSIIIYHDRKSDVEMMLLAIDFENEVVKLSPIDKDYYEDEDYLVSISKISILKKEKKLKIIK